MIDEIKKVQKVQDNSVWEYRILPFLSVAVGAIVLWSVWFFYHDRWGDSDFPWYRGIQPVLMVIGALLCFFASIQLFLRQPSGKDWLKMAWAVIPIIFALRLLIVVLVVISRAIF